MKQTVIVNLMLNRREKLFLNNLSNTKHCIVVFTDVLRQYFPTLPKDPRTLLHTQVTWCVRSSRWTVLSLCFFIKLITESWTTLVFIGWWILLLASNKYWLFVSRVQVISSGQYWGKQNLCDKTVVRQQN